MGNVRPMNSSRYTEGDYLAHNPDWHDADAVWKVSQIVPFLASNGCSPRSICDIGCGTGGVLAALMPAFPEAEGLGFDLSQQAARRAAEIHPQVRVKVGDPSEHGVRVDLAMMIDVFEHVEDYYGFLRRMGPVGQQTLFHIPLDMNALNIMREHRIRSVRELVGHLHYFSKLTALETLVDTGYRVIDSRFTLVGTYAEAVGFKANAIKQAMRVGFSLRPESTARILGGASLLVLAEWQND